MKRNTIPAWCHGCGTLILQLIPLIWLFFPQGVYPASLEPNTAKAWDAYIATATTRMEQRLSPGNSFLWVDELPERRAKVRAGESIVSPVGPHHPNRVPSGLIHDWIGAAFIPGATLRDVLQTVRDYARYKELYRPSVIDSKAVVAGESKDLFSLLLIDKSFCLKMALKTDYESRYVHLDERRGYGVARTTRIQEIEDYGAAAQRTLPEGEGTGIIWRLFSISRYAERDGGVYIELEAIGLSRDIPASLRWFVEPIVRRVSREALSTSLRQTERAVAVHAELAKGSTVTAQSITPSAHGRTEYLWPPYVH